MSKSQEIRMLKNRSTAKTVMTLFAVFLSISGAGVVVGFLAGLLAGSILAGVAVVTLISLPVSFVVCRWLWRQRDVNLDDIELVESWLNGARSTEEAQRRKAIYRQGGLEGVLSHIDEAWLRDYRRQSETKVALQRAARQKERRKMAADVLQPAPQVSANGGAPILGGGIDVYGDIVGSSYMNDRSREAASYNPNTEHFTSSSGYMPPH